MKHAQGIWCVCMCAYVCIGVCLCVRARARVRVCMCMLRVCFCDCVRVYVYVCVRAYLSFVSVWLPGNFLQNLRCSFGLIAACSPVMYARMIVRYMCV